MSSCSTRNARINAISSLVNGRVFIFTSTTSATTSRRILITTEYLNEHFFFIRVWAATVHIHHRYLLLLPISKADARFTVRTWNWRLNRPRLCSTSVQPLLLYVYRSGCVSGDGVFQCVELSSRCLPTARSHRRANATSRTARLAVPSTATSSLTRAGVPGVATVCTFTTFVRGIYTTMNFTMCRWRWCVGDGWAWLTVRGGRGRRTISIEKQTWI